MFFKKEGLDLNRRVVSPYIPSTLTVRQAKIGLTFKVTTGWKFKGRWLRSLAKILKATAGAKAIGCFGYEPHAVLEITPRCNMRCIHCEIRGGEVERDPPLKNVLKMIDSIATVPEFRMLVLTGGDPLMRADLCQVIRYAKDVGFEVTIATNGTLITKKMAKKLSSLDVTGNAISLDFIEPKLHNRFRGVSGAWEKTIEGARNTVREGLFLQVNITLSKLNFHELPQLLHLADRLGAHIVLLYQFQPFGRGSFKQDIALSALEYLKVIKTVSSLQNELETLVVPVGLPEYFAYLAANGTSLLRNMLKGCLAGRGMFYVKWYGDVWPCVFLQTSVGNVLEKPAIEIWRNSKLLINLRDRGNLGEPCRSCSYVENCGGCRSRAFLFTGNPLEADPMCPFRSRIALTPRQKVNRNVLPKMPEMSV